MNFWNTWCIPCQQEHPALKQFYARHRDDPDFALVGIVRDDTRRAAGQYAKAEGIDWIIAMDPGPAPRSTSGTADNRRRSRVAMNAWPPQASYPCGNFSDTS